MCKVIGKVRTVCLALVVDAAIATFRDVSPQTVSASLDELRRLL